MHSPQELRTLLTGPVMSVHTPFTRDGAIDYGSLRGLVDRGIDAGSTTMLLTYGDSLYSLLTDDEVAEVTRVVAEQTAGRAAVVAADRIWWTGKTVEFARYAREVGADVLMVLPPDWAGSCTADSFVAHYAAVAVEIPVMVVTNAFSRSPAMGLEVLRRLRDDDARRHCNQRRPGGRISHARWRSCCAVTGLSFRAGRSRTTLT